MFTGRNTRDCIQAFVDVTKNKLDNDDNISISRDFDSLIGTSRNILVSAPISVFPIPNPSAALTTSIHIKWPVEQDDAELIDVRT